MISEDILILPDGRRMGYGLYGNLQGTPILDFHGIPGSRREAALIDSYLQRQDVCFIGFDRPGYGRSSPRRNTRVADIPADVIALTDHLNLDCFLMLAYSGGAPFALAVAAAYPERVSALGIVSGIGPAEVGAADMHEGNRKKFNLAQRHPQFAKLALSLAFNQMRRHADRLPQQLQTLWQKLPAVDQKVLQDETYKKGIIDITLDAIQNTAKGWVEEEVLVTLPWQINLNEIRCRNIYLWHGGQDRNVPLKMAQATAAQLPACKTYWKPEEGHLSLLYHHGGEIVSTLLQHAG